MNRTARIMLVEDDRDVVASLSESLSSQGYRIDFAEDLTTAQVLLTTRPPDLVLLDIHSFQVQARVITASHQDLVHQVRIGRFREDLWFRLNVLTVETSALKERMEDLGQLCRHFLDQASQRNHLPPRNCSQAALDVLRRHDWPGNVRELRNLMERLVATSDPPWVEVEELQVLLPHHPEFYPAAPRSAGVNDSDVGIFPQCVEEIQPLRSWRIHQVQSYVQHALRLCGGNVTRAAEMLHIDRTTLHSYTINSISNKDIS